MPYTRAAPAPLVPTGHASPPALAPAPTPAAASPVPTAGANAPAGPPAPARLPNGDPMLATRVRPPRPPAAAFLHRDRLLGRLDAAALRPVTLVNGPAGAGKTLLVADWLARGRLPGPAGWLTLEPSDNQPGTFWAYVREALQTGVGGLPAEVGAPARAEHVEPSLLLRLAAWINARPRPLVLVLDECEHLDNLRLAEQLHDLVRHTAGRLRLVLVGRSEPLLPLHRYRAAGELAEIRAGELALNRAETAAVLERHGLRVGPAAVEAVHHALSGWTAGVRLLALAAQDADDPEAYLGRIDAGPTALSDFLLAEVLRAQPAPTQDLLLRSSILGRVHPDLADALTGRRDGRRILDRLHQDNAFTDALPDGWYRLHPMFAGILRLHLRAAAPERVDELRVRAAHWLAGHGQYRAALDHAAEAGAWALAARLLVDEFALGELLAGRDATRLCALFSRMPPSEHSPAAELVRAAVHLTRDEAASALRILEHVEPLLPAERTALQLAAVLVRTGAARLLGSAPLADRAARRAGELEHRVPADLPERHPELLALMAADLGSTLLWHGRLDEACRALERAARAPLSPATARLRHDALCRLALVDHLRGWPGRAERRVREADEQADRSACRRTAAPRSGTSCWPPPPWSATSRPRPGRRCTGRPAVARRTTTRWSPWGSACSGPSCSWPRAVRTARCGCWTRPGGTGSRTGPPTGAASASPSRPAPRTWPPDGRGRRSRPWRTCRSGRPTPWWWRPGPGSRPAGTSRAPWPGCGPCATTRPWAARPVPGRCCCWRRPRSSATVPTAPGCWPRPSPPPSRSGSAGRSASRRRGCADGCAGCPNWPAPTAGCRTTCGHPPATRPRSGVRTPGRP